MVFLSDDESQQLARGEAHQRCMHELGRPHPDYEAAQVFATLSLEEAVRDAIAELAHLARSVTVATRRR